MACSVKRGRVKRLAAIGKGVESVKEVVLQYDCAALTILNLHSNGVSSFSGLETLWTLTDLNLSANRILSLRGFPVLKRLTTLNLATNGLTTCEGMPLLPKLKTLVLTHNRLRQLDGLELYRNGQLTHVDLRGNPLEGVECCAVLRQITTLREVRIDESRRDDRHRAAASQLTAPQPAEVAVPGAKSAVQLEESGQKVVVGYPVRRSQAATQTGATDVRAQAVQTDSAARVAPVEYRDQSVWTEELLQSDVEMKSASTEASFPCPEASKLRTELEDSRRQLNLVQEELTARQEKQSRIETEFLRKLQNVKECAAAKLKASIAQAAENAKQERADYEKEMVKLSAQLKASAEAVSALKKLSIKMNGELETLKAQNADLDRERDEQKTRFEEKLRYQEQRTDDARRAHERVLSEISQERSIANDRLQEKDQITQELKEALASTSRDLQTARYEADALQTALRRQVENLECQKQELNSQIQQLQEKALATEHHLRELDDKHESAKAAWENEKCEMERVFQQNSAEAVRAALKEGEANEKAAMEEKLQQETQRLKNTFKIVEARFREAQTVSEAQNDELRNRLKAEEDRAGEMKRALQFGMQRSQQQEAIMKDMRTVIQKQKLTILALKDEAQHLSNQVDASSLSRQKTLEQEARRLSCNPLPAVFESQVAALREAAAEATELRERLEKREREVSEVQSEVERLTKEGREEMREAQQQLSHARSDLQRLRIKNAELFEISERLHSDKQSLSDAVKVKEKMLESANSTISELKEANRECQRDARELKDCLEETEAELERRQREVESRVAQDREEWQRTVEQLEASLRRETESVQSLRARLQEKQTAYEEKTKIIDAVESEIDSYKTKCEARMKKMEEERNTALEKLKSAIAAEQSAKATTADAEYRTTQMEASLKVELNQKQKLREVGLKLRNENKALNQRVSEVEGDMKRLLASLEAERRQSADKIQQLERILSELRTPLLKYRP